MRLSGQFQACLFIFFYEKVLTVKIAPKRKTNDFQVFARTKNVAFVV